jgi:spermidine synthase
MTGPYGEPAAPAGPLGWTAAEELPPGGLPSGNLASGDLPGEGLPGEEPLPPGLLPEPPATGARLPVGPGFARGLVLAAVFVCAACGLAYELELVAIASYLIGDTVTQTSVVLSVMVFAMGIGSLLAKRWCGRAAAGFGAVEVLLALVGGLSVFALHGCFAWYGPSPAAVVGCSFAIGVLCGAEIPLLMMLIQRIRRQDAGGAVADVFAADYVGGLAGGLAFPFVLLPLLGQLDGALLTGAINAVAGAAVVLWLFRRDLSRRARGLLCAANAAVLAVLALAAFFAGAFESAARHAVYGPHVRHVLHTPVQEIVLTGRGPRGLHLFLDGRLRVSGTDEYRYHEALVHPAMAGRHHRVLVLGGGDGLALREVLRYPDVRSVTLVDLDPVLVRLARTDPDLSALNHHSHDDPRVRTVAADAFEWLRSRAPAGRYDVILGDLPDPGISQSAKLYSREFYGLAARALAPGGRLAVHTGAPRTRPRVFWTVAATVRSAGLGTVEYRVGGAMGDFGAGPDPVSPHHVGTAHDWGFVLAARHRPALRLDPRAPRLRSLTPASLRRAGAIGRSPGRHREPPSTLMHPRY